LLKLALTVKILFIIDLLFCLFKIINLWGQFAWLSYWFMYDNHQRLKVEQLEYRNIWIKFDYSRFINWNQYLVGLIKKNPFFFIASSFPLLRRHCRRGTGNQGPPPPSGDWRRRGLVIRKISISGWYDLLMVMVVLV
jgi:hypothetical protein